MKIELILVDDDKISLLITERILKAYNFPIKFNGVLTFSDSRSALEYVLNLPTSDDLAYIILLDINMPKLNGWEFLDLVKDVIKDENVYFMMLTSSISEFDIDKANAYPLVKEYLSKPFDFNKCKTVEDLIEKYLS